MSADGAAVLDGRVALVAGASGGIGREVARLLRQAGAWVGMIGRRADVLTSAAAEIGGRPFAGDVTDAARVERIVAEAERDAAQPIDIVVNAAGAFMLAKVWQTEPAAFRRMVEVNLVAPFLLARAVLPAMIARGDGDVLTIGSVAGRQAFPENGAYAAGKFGVRGLHAVLVAELRGTGVRATFIEPAATDTPLWDAIDRARHPALPPREAMLQPQAVAQAVLFALSRPPGVVLPNILVERS